MFRGFVNTGHLFELLIIIIIIIKNGCLVFTKKNVKVIFKSLNRQIVIYGLKRF